MLMGTLNCYFNLFVRKFRLIFLHQIWSTAHTVNQLFIVFGAENTLSNLNFYLCFIHKFIL